MSLLLPGGGGSRKHFFKAAQAEHVKDLAAQELPYRKVAAMEDPSATTLVRILQGV